MWAVEGEGTDKMAYGQGGQDTGCSCGSRALQPRRMLLKYGAPGHCALTSGVAFSTVVWLLYCP